MHALYKVYFYDLLPFQCAHERSVIYTILYNVMINPAVVMDVVFTLDSMSVCGSFVN